MPQAPRSHGTPRWIAGFAALFLIAPPAGLALATYDSDTMTGKLLATSPVPHAATAVSTPAPPSALPAAPEVRERTEVKSPATGDRPASPAWLNRLARKSQGPGPDSWWLVMGGMALALAICGGGAILARRFSPGMANGTIQVVGRVSLSPRHTVYLLRVGQRVLLLGAGPQGAPALLGDLDELAEVPPAAEQGGQP